MTHLFPEPSPTTLHEGADFRQAEMMPLMIGAWGNQPRALNINSLPKEVRSQFIIVGSRAVQILELPRKVTEKIQAENVPVNMADVFLKLGIVSAIIIHDNRKYQISELKKSMSWVYRKHQGLLRY